MTTTRVHRIAVGLVLAGLVAAGIPVVASAAKPADPAVARIENGQVRGTADAEARQFFGIPYAAAPLGRLRWETPRRAPDWPGVRPAVEAGPGCPQPTDLPISAADQSEDCLTLNVTAPTGARRSPVVVYFHGGSFNYGVSANYDPRAMAVQGDVVVVTLNYRLGVFGFLAHPSLEDAANLGLVDQQAALRWVRRNASAFGGDPRNVTIMGQSAGGHSVCAHLAAPSSAGLFQRAIVQSAPCAGDNAHPLADAERQALALATEVGCPDAGAAERCLRDKSPAELVAAAGAGHDGFRPVSGTRLLPRDPATAIATGRFNRVPVLHGSAHDEEGGQLGGLELQPGAVPLSREDYPLRIADLYGPDAAAVLAEYPLSAYPTPSEALVAVLTDANWARQAYETHRVLARYVPTYAYEFAERDTSWFPGLAEPSFPVGASHMLDLPYLFDVGYLTDAPRPELRAALIAYWTTFAHKGNPNTAGLPSWPKFHSGQYVQSLAAGRIHGTNFAADHHYDFWQNH